MARSKVNIMSEKIESKKPKFDMKLAEQADKEIQKTGKAIYLVVCGRGGEHNQYVEYFNWSGRLKKKKAKAKRLYGIGFCAFVGLVRLHKMFNEKRPILNKIPYQRRNKLTGKIETRFKYEPSGKFIHGWKAIAQHLSKFVSITEDELKKIVKPYRDAPRLYFFTRYEELGVSLHGQPDNIEAFMGFKNFWKCSSGKPLMCNTAISEHRFAWLNKRAQELAKQQGLKGYYQVRIAPLEED